MNTSASATAPLPERVQVFSTTPRPSTTIRRVVFVAPVFGSRIVFRFRHSVGLSFSTFLGAAGLVGGRAGLAGAVPVAMVTPNAAAVAEEFRAALEAARQRIAPICADVAQRKRWGEYVPDSLYWRARELQEALSRAKRIKTHKARLAALAAVAS